MFLFGKFFKPKGAAPLSVTLVRAAIIVSILKLQSLKLQDLNIKNLRHTPVQLLRINCISDNDLEAFWHVDSSKMTCRNSNRASQWIGRRDLGDFDCGLVVGALQTRLSIPEATIHTGSSK